VALRELEFGVGNQVLVLGERVGAAAQGRVQSVHAGLYFLVPEAEDEAFR
jgi:hypothetical protein